MYCLKIWLSETSTILGVQEKLFEPYFLYGENNFA
jgi:hypothetical protein